MTNAATCSGARIGVRNFRPSRLAFIQAAVHHGYRKRFISKHGGKALIYAKFVPIIRTFAPFMAGVGKMPYARFLMFNVAGGLAWVLFMVIAGYFLGQFPLVRRHFEKIVILVVLISVAPILIQLGKNKLAARPVAGQ